MFRLAFLNLFRRKLRVVLIALTVIMTMGSLVAIMILGDSLAQGLQDHPINKGFFEGIDSEFIKFVRNVLIFFNILALFVGIIVILNTFMVILTQRSKELALLRVIGASKSRIFKLVSWEAVLIGLGGALIAIFVGVGLAQLILIIIENLDWDIPSSGLKITPFVFIWPIVLGILSTVTASFIPAIAASRKSPLKALTMVGGAVKKLSKAWFIIGSILLSIGLALSLSIIFTSLGEISDSSDTKYLIRIITLAFGNIFIFLGFIFLAILLARVLARMSMNLLKNSRFVSWRLAAGNIWREPLRYAVVSIVLMIGVMLITQITVIISSFNTTVNYFVEQVYPANLVVEVEIDFFGREAVEAGSTPPIQPEDYERIKNLDETAEEIGIRWQEGATYLFDPTSDALQGFRGDEDYFGLIGIDVTDRIQNIFTFLDQQLVDELAKGRILVNDFELESNNWQVGDEINLFFREDQPYVTAPQFAESDTSEAIPAFEEDEPQNTNPVYQQTFIIGGVFERNILSFGLDFVLSNDAFEEFTQISRYNAIYINNAPGYSDEQVLAAIEEITDPLDVMINSREDVYDQVDSFFRIITNIFRGLLSLSFLVAIGGIFSVLLLSVFERVREIGLLRAIGMPALGVRRIIIIEAIQIATLGVFLGTLLGIFTAWGILEVAFNDPFASSGREVEFNLRFSIPYLELLMYYVVAVILALLAALGPSFKATRLKIIEAITSK